MSDEQIQTGPQEVPLGVVLTQARQHPLPWALFGVCLVLLLVVGVTLARQVAAQTQATEHERYLRTQAEQALQVAEAARVQAAAQVSGLERQLREASEQREVLAANLKKLEAERAGAKRAAVKQPIATAAKKRKKR